MKVDKSKWEKRVFTDIGTSQLGKTLDSKRNTGELRPYLCAANVGYGKFNINELKQIRIEDCELEKYLVKKGDMLICEGGDTGRCAIWEEDYPIYYQNALHRVRFNNDVFNRFVMYAMHYYKRVGIIDRLSHGQTIKHFTQKSLSRLFISVPSLFEQKGIAAELDAIQAMIDGYREQLADLDALAQSIFLDTFGDPISNPKGWEVKCLGDVCKVTSSKRIYQEELVGNGVPFYRISDFPKLIQGENIDTDIFILEEKYIELKTKNLVPHKGDLLITSRGTLGTCYIVKGSDKFYFQDGMITWLRDFNKDILSSFIAFIFNASFIKAQLLRAQNGSTVAYLSISMIRKLKIPFPPLPLQQQFAAQVEAIEKQKELLRQQIADAETLMAERMQYYFS